MDSNNNSGVNTILIVVVLVAIVGFGVWYFTGGMEGQSTPAEDNAEFNMNIEVPAGDNNGGAEEPAQ